MLTMWYENLAGQLESNVSHASRFDALVRKNAKDKVQWQSVVRWINKPQDVSDSGAVRNSATLRGRHWRGMYSQLSAKGTSTWGLFICLNVGTKLKSKKR